MEGRVDVVVLHKATVQEQLFVHNLTPLVHGLEVMRRVGVVRTSVGGLLHFGSCEDDRPVVSRVVGEGGFGVRFGRIALSHVN